MNLSVPSSTRTGTHTSIRERTNTNAHDCYCRAPILIHSYGFHPTHTITLHVLFFARSSCVRCFPPVEGATLLGSHVHTHTYTRSQAPSSRFCTCWVRLQVNVFVRANCGMHEYCKTKFSIDFMCQHCFCWFHKTLQIYSMDRRIDVGISRFSHFHFVSIFSVSSMLNEQSFLQSIKIPLHLRLISNKIIITNYACVWGVCVRLTQIYILLILLMASHFLDVFR